MKRIAILAVGAAFVLALTLSLASCTQLDKLEDTTGLTAGQTLVIAGETWSRIDEARTANAAARTGAKEAQSIQPPGGAEPASSGSWWSRLLPW